MVALLGAVLIGLVSYPSAYAMHCAPPQPGYDCSVSSPQCGALPPAWAGARVDCWKSFTFTEQAWLALAGIAVILVTVALGAGWLLRFRHSWFVALAGPLLAWALWWQIGLALPGRDGHLTLLAVLDGALAHGLAASLAFPDSRSRLRSYSAAAVATASASVDLVQVLNLVR